MKFSILGAGWLGSALALALKSKYEIKVSLRNSLKEQAFKEQGYKTYILNEDNYLNLKELLDSDYIFINFPPSKFENYLKFIETIVDNIDKSRIRKVFFVSSTSIYPSNEDVYDESFNIRRDESKAIVFDAEEIAKTKSDVILRAAGLMGYDRVAGKMFSNRIVKSSNKKINHVHRDDVIEAVKFIIQKDINGIFNLCAPIHPLRDELYISNAEKYNFTKPIIELKEEFLNRVIDGSKIEKYGFRYKYQNPMNF